MDPDQTARMCRLVWIHAGRKRTMLVLLLRGSNESSKEIAIVRILSFVNKIQCRSEKLSKYSGE
jgi:hypothetical protein